MATDLTTFTFTVYSAGYLVAGLVALVIAWVAAKSRHRNGASELSALMLMAAGWSFLGIMETASMLPESKIFWAKWEYLGAATTPVFYFIFVMKFTGRKLFRTTRTYILLFIIPALTIFFAFANEKFNFLWSGFGPVSPITNLMIYHHGPWFWVGYMGYSYLLLIAASVSLFAMSLKQAKVFIAQSAAIFLGGLFPWIASLLYLTSLNPVEGYDLTRVSIIMSGVIITFAKYNYRLFDLVPIAREVLIETMQDGMLVLDSQKNIQDINPAASRFLGVDKDNIIGKNLQTLAVKDNALIRLIMEGKTGKPEIISINGTGTILEMHIQPLKKQAGSQQILLHDITAIKSTEHQLQASLEKYRIIAESTSDVIWTMDTSMRYTYVSPSILQNRGFTPQEFINQSPLDIFSENSLHKVKELISHHLDLFNHGLYDKDERFIFELEHKCKDGSIKIGEVHAKPLINNEGIVLGIHGVTRDITERKKAEAIANFRMHLMEFAGENSHKDLMVKILDDICRFAGSPIGFFHLLSQDENTVELQVWSTETSERFCKVPKLREHYNIHAAGVWVDCVRQRKPLIHNDYHALKHKKGLPEGHADVTRELTVPIFRNNQIIAIIGIGNKQSDYTEQDLALVSALADIAWDISEKKGAQEALVQREILLKATADAVSILLHGDEIHQALNQALEILGNATNADRVYIFENHLSPVNGQLLMSQRLEWCSAQVESQIDNPGMQNLSYVENFPRWPEIMSGGQVIKGLVSSFPESERRILEPQNILSILLTPVMMGDRFWGFIGFDECKYERTWSVIEEHLLSAAAYSVGAAYIRKRHEEELTVAKEKAEESDRLKTAFLNNMSHEIRTPMNGISGFANLLKEDDLTTDERNRYIEVINASTDQLLSIINDVLELSRLESTKVPVSQSRFSLNVMIEEIATILRPKTLKKQLEMTSVKPLALSESFMEGDKEKIKQVLTGLINNALKFTHSGGIKFGYEVISSKIRFYVHDTGIGLPSSEHIRDFRTVLSG